VNPYQVVIDTNVIVSALRSRRGSSYKLLMLIGSEKFEINLSVPLMLEYEKTAKKLIGKIDLLGKDIDGILDYLASVANRRQVFYLWRPFLKDPKDDMVLELAVAGNCDFIVTYNKIDFQGVESFGVRTLTPKEFLQKIGELP